MKIKIVKFKRQSGCTRKLVKKFLKSKVENKKLLLLDSSSKRYVLNNFQECIEHQDDIIFLSGLNTNEIVADKIFIDSYNNLEKIVNLCLQNNVDALIHHQDRE